MRTYTRKKSLFLRRVMFCRPQRCFGYGVCPERAVQAAQLRVMIEIISVAILLAGGDVYDVYVHDGKIGSCDASLDRCISSLQ